MLNRKLFRDLLQNFTQFLSIFLMAFLGICFFFGLYAESLGLNEAGESYYDEYNMADFWITGKKFDENDIRNLLSLEKISQAELRKTIQAKVKLQEEPSITLHYIQSCEISKMNIAEGNEYDSSLGGIWLDVLFAKKNKLSVGDEIILKIDNQDVCEEIRGLVYSPEYIYYLENSSAMFPDYGKYGFGFLNVTDYPHKESETIEYNEVVVVSKEKLKDTQEIRQMKEKIEKVFPDENIIVQDRDMTLSYNTFHSEAEQHKTFAIIFPIIFLMIAILGIITTMSRITSNQRVQIGTLKALGFSKTKITIHYCTFGFVISLFGSILGAFAGYLLLPPFMFSIMSEYYIVPSMKARVDIAGVIVIIIQVLVSTITGLVACRKELKDNPADTLKPKAPKIKKIPSKAIINFMSKMTFATQWNLRDITRNRIRTIMGVIGVAGAAMLLVCALGMNDSFNNITESMFHDIYNYQYKIGLEEQVSKDDANEINLEYRGQMIMEKTVEIFGENVRKSGTITVVDEGNYIHFIDRNKREMKIPTTGVCIASKLADQLGVGLGDIITFKILGKEEVCSVRISGIYMAYMGQGIAMSRQAYEALEYDFEPTSILTRRHVKSDLSDQDNCVQSVAFITDMKAQINNSLEAMMAMIYILIVLAVCLGFVVLYNLGSLSYMEKTREIATLKVLGFPLVKIRQILQAQNNWITITGIGIGLPLGYGFVCAMVPTLSDSMDMIACISLISYIVAAIGTYLVSVWVNYALSKKIKTIDMVEALKGRE